MLVCVHGLGGSSRWWLPVLDRLPAGRGVRLLDVPRRVRASAAAQWLAEELEGLGPPVDLAAHSLGGLAASRLAAARPELVRRLVLVSPAGLPARRPLVAYGPALAAAVVRSQPSFLPVLVTDALRAGPLNLVRGGLHAVSTDLRDDLANIASPTLLVWGERDRIVPFRLAAEWERVLPNARLVPLPRAGHVPMFDVPEELTAAVVEFLDETRDDTRM